MNTPFNFKSQICTTREQSERLLSLGLKRETADMGWGTITLNGEPITFSSEDSWDDVEITEIHIPAWSLHRIMSLINSEEWNTEITLKDGRYIIYYGYDVKMTEEPYDVLIDAIEYQITVGVFNKEYLEE